VFGAFQTGAALASAALTAGGSDGTVDLGFWGVFLEVIRCVAVLASCFVSMGRPVDCMRGVRRPATTGMSVGFLGHLACGASTGYIFVVRRRRCRRGVSLCGMRQLGCAVVLTAMCWPHDCGLFQCCSWQRALFCYNSCATGGCTQECAPLVSTRMRHVMARSLVFVSCLVCALRDSPCVSMAAALHVTAACASCTTDPHPLIMRCTPLCMP
jgi:hypothetical protein